MFREKGGDKSVYCAYLRFSNDQRLKKGGMETVSVLRSHGDKRIAE